MNPKRLFGSQRIKIAATGVRDDSLALDELQAFDMSLFVAPWPFGRNKARPLVGIADREGLMMATSSKHDHKNVGCHRIGPPPRNGDRVLATIRTPAEIDKHRSSFATADVALGESIQPLFGVMLPNGARKPISKP